MQTTHVRALKKMQRTRVATIYKIVGSVAVRNVVQTVYSRAVTTDSDIPAKADALRIESVKNRHQVGHGQRNKLAAEEGELDDLKPARIPEQLQKVISIFRVSRLILSLLAVAERQLACCQTGRDNRPASRSIFTHVQKIFDWKLFCKEQTSLK